MNSPNLGVSSEDPGKYVLGTVPVEADGSAHFRVPSGVSVFFQALDQRGVAVQTMRSLTYVQPTQTLSCVGCHESRELAPPIRKAPLAALRQPSRIALGPAGSWPLRYDRLVQPVLDRHCAECHDPVGQASLPVARPSKLDLTAGRSYQSLISFGGEDLKKLAFERDRSIPGQGTAANSKLYALLTRRDGHEGVRLDAESLDRIVTWMDTYAQRQGHFSDAQERELEKAREAWAAILVAGSPDKE
jgi:hypothetical protein